MLFNRRPKCDEPYVVTGRKIAAYKRSCREKQNKFPLLAPLIAETQRSPEDEMAWRLQNFGHRRDTMRDLYARQWRDARARYYALPPHVRAVVRERWRRWGGPRKGASLGYVLREELPAIPVAPEDFAFVPEDRRTAEIRRLNDLARHESDYPWANSRKDYSPGALQFLAPGFEPHDGYEFPKLHLHTSRSRLCKLHEVVSAYDAFSHNTDPTGLRERGVFDCLGEQLEFRVLTLRYKGEGQSPAPWNVDYTRRIVFITGPDGR